MYECFHLESVQIICILKALLRYTVERNEMERGIAREVTAGVYVVLGSGGDRVGGGNGGDRAAVGAGDGCLLAGKEENIHIL